MNFLAENDILLFKNDQRLERILWINDNHTYCYTIVIETSKLKINIYNMDVLYEDCDANSIKVLIKDPTYKVMLEDKISNKCKHLMDKMYGIVEYLASEKNEPDIFNENTRRKKILDAVEKFKSSEPTIYKYLRLYWQGGKLKQSLIPQYNKCGGKGKEKKLTDKKIGRPTGTPKSKYDLSYTFEENNEMLGEGINITEEIKDIFRLVLKKYHKDGTPISIVYQRMLDDYFSKVVVENGMNVLKILPYAIIPKYNQLLYWTPRIESEEEKNIVNLGINQYKKKSLITEAGTTEKSLGPGFRFEIDATYSQVYLVNRIDENLNVGEAIYYFVVDEFSRYVNGIEVTLNKPSGVGAMNAIYSCSLNKVELCKRYGLVISEEDWPYPGTIRKLEADNGELAGLIPENAIKNLRIELINTRSYNPTDKPIVERLFGIVKNKLRPFVPGMVKKGGKKPGEKDKRQDAILNIDEFTKIILRSVIWHNNNIMEDYKLSPDLIRDGVPKIPKEIYKWGIKHFSGAPKHFDDNFLKLNLMTSGKATVTSEGVMFRTLYDCDIARVEEWYQRAKDYGNWKVDIRYDRSNLDNIYVINPNGNEFEVCTIKHKNDYCRNKTIEEIIQYQVSEKRKDKILKNIENQRTADFYVGMQADIKLAKKNRDSRTSSKANKKTMTQNIIENRKSEVEALNKDRAMRLENQNDGDNKIIHGEMNKDY
jgi:hypothetical protein